MSHKYEPYRIYSKRSKTLRATQEMGAEELHVQVDDFFTVYHPAKGKPHHLAKYMEYARAYGVSALKLKLKQHYGVNFDEADSSARGWLRLKKNIEEFCTHHRQHFIKPGLTLEDSVKNLYGKAVAEGVYELDKFLKDKVGQTIASFTARSLNAWKSKWSSLLGTLHEERTVYEVKRYFNALSQTSDDSVSPDYTNPEECFDTYHEILLKDGRDELNNRLLKEYKLSLEDVKMIPGVTEHERQSNLQRKITEFYQRYNSNMEEEEEDEDDDRFISLPRSPSRISRVANSVGNSKELTAINRGLSKGAKKVRALSLKLEDFGATARSRTDSTLRGLKKRMPTRQFGSRVGSSFFENAPKLSNTGKKKKKDRQKDEDNDDDKTSSPDHLIRNSSFGSNVNIKARGSLDKMGSMFRGSIFGGDGTKRRRTAKSANMSMTIMGEPSFDVLVLTDRQLKEIEELAVWGTIELEQLNQQLMDRFGADLETLGRDKIILRLLHFYSTMGLKKSAAKITQVAEYGIARGLQDMNKNLMVAHGSGIEIADLVD